MKLLSYLVLGISLVVAAGCGGNKNSQVSLVSAYNAKYGESRNSVRQSQGVQVLPQGWNCTAADTQATWTSPTPNDVGFVSKSVVLEAPNGAVKQEEDRFVLTTDMPRKALTIISQFDGDKVSGQTACMENATPEGKPIPMEEAKGLIKTVVK